MGPFPWTVTSHPCRRSATLPLNTVPWSLWTKATPLASWGLQDGGSTWPLRPWVGLVRVGGKPPGQPPRPTHEPGCSGGHGGSGSFPCRGTDELLGVMDQVTIINSTLGKALGGASGVCRLGSLGSLYLHAQPWRGLGGGGKGRPGAAGKKTAWTVLSGGPWGKLWLLFSPLFTGGYTTGPGALVSLLRQRARPYLFSNSLPPAAVGCASKALDLLMESNAIVQSMAAKTLRCGPGQGGARWGEGAGEGLPCVAAQAHNSLPLRPASAHLRVPSGLHWDLALLTRGYLLAPALFSLSFPSISWCISCIFIFFIFWPYCLWDLSSPTKDRIHAPCIGSMEY